MAITAHPCPGKRYNYIKRLPMDEFTLLIRNEVDHQKTLSPKKSE